MLLPGERWWQCRWQRVPAGSASLPAAPRAPARCSAGSGAAGCVLLQEHLERSTSAFIFSDPSTTLQQMKRIDLYENRNGLGRKSKAQSQDDPVPSEGCGVGPGPVAVSLDVAAATPVPIPLLPGARPREGSTRAGSSRKSSLCIAPYTRKLPKFDCENIHKDIEWLGTCRHSLQGYRTRNANTMQGYNRACVPKLALQSGNRSITSTGLQHSSSPRCASSMRWGTFGAALFCSLSLAHDCRAHRWSEPGISNSDAFVPCSEARVPWPRQRSREKCSHNPCANFTPNWETAKPEQRCSGCPSWCSPSKAFHGANTYAEGEPLLVGTPIPQAVRAQLSISMKRLQVPGQWPALAPEHRTLSTQLRCHRAHEPDEAQAGSYLTRNAAHTLLLNPLPKFRLQIPRDETHPNPFTRTNRPQRALMVTNRTP
ncbi:hypothetical protein Anapl_04361 [Anas platyrhynchos]|uniref:Uncharacterized protein n=1 Tax=Anas platyrhynchos TaxID=8839 RepID=R0L061_ANAPL|nr:hypothetical protein Anapl_04361 [Anas platyrhynchos]